MKRDDVTTKNDHIWATMGFVLCSIIWLSLDADMMKEFGEHVSIGFPVVVLLSGLMMVVLWHRHLNQGEDE